ncbi:universal stress protein [Haloplanus ruber]|uniref:Universal stress protein n=1 Tax=Haloplanus ruber TaxID=869892 RepID=A0ABD6CZZ6_9EURY|nr:universal stress protein [Haloplanus ruber]
MYRNILVPTDGSDASAAAVEHAVDLADRYDAHIYALYVVDSGSYGVLGESTPTVVEALREEGSQAVTSVEGTAADAGVEVDTAVVEGAVHRSILDHADEVGADLIVMGTHGRQGIDRYLLGSVTERIVRSSSVPVLTVRSSDDSER